MKIYVEQGTFEKVYNLKKKYNALNNNQYENVSKLYNNLSVYDSLEKKEEISFLYNYYKLLNCGINFLEIKEIPTCTAE